jgi:hypothetical protein
MKPSLDDSRIRELCQRLKRADEKDAPAFDDVWGRAARTWEQRRARRLRLAAVCGAAAALLVAFLFVRLQQVDPIIADGPLKVTSKDERIVEVDFDRLRRVVEEHFSAAETANNVGVPVWSSRTESLLALNLTVSLAQD